MLSMEYTRRARNRCLEVEVGEERSAPARDRSAKWSTTPHPYSYNRCSRTFLHSSYRNPLASISTYSPSSARRHLFSYYPLCQPPRPLTPLTQTTSQHHTSNLPPPPTSPLHHTTQFDSMARDIVRYTPTQLHHLRDSPLVQKPDGLPSIEQWMEPQPAHDSSRRPRSQVLRDGEQPANGEARVDRPILNALGMGNFGRRPSARNFPHVGLFMRPFLTEPLEPEDTVLGPPKLSFTSASRNAKPLDGTEKRGLAAIDSEGSLADRIGSRERWSKDRFESDRSREKSGFQNGRRGGREEGEGWTNVKSRKSLGQDEIERPHRNGDRDRFHKDGDLDNGESGTRRAGLGRGRFEQPWGREDPATKEGDGAKSGTRGQGWRDRERDKERDRDPPRERDWTRGRGGIEEDPEWMDTVVTEKKPARTQEDFQKWKEEQKEKTKPQDKKEPMQEPAPSVAEPVSVPVPTPHPAQQKSVAPFAMEIGTEKLFGIYGEGKRADSNAAENATLAKAAKAKPKPSRFAGLFYAPEEPVAKAQAPVETPTSPPPAANHSTNTEDKEGFQRILQMLGGTNIAGQPNLGIAVPSNGTRQGIRPDFQHPQGDEGATMPLQTRQHIPRAREDQQYAEHLLSLKPAALEAQARPPVGIFGIRSPENESGPDQYRYARPESGRPAEDFPFPPPARNGGSQETLIQQALAKARPAPEPFRDSKRDFLLTLMQQPSRGTPPQMTGHNLPRQQADTSNFLSFMENNTLQGQGPPKNRGPPPGIYDDPRMYSDNEMLRREINLREASIRDVNMRDAGLREASIREANMNMRETSIREANIRDANMRDANMRDANMRDANMRDANMREGMPTNDSLRKAMGRPPPGIYDDPSIAGLTRRNTTENMPRQPTNMGIPQQPISELPLWMKGPGMPQPSSERNVAPPPGFPPTAMRQPPGFGGPPVGNPPNMPFSAGNTPLGHPGMLPRGMGGPAGMFAGQPPGQMPPPGPPSGYFGGPPGFGPMGMPRGDDPRMMMGPRRPEYDQFNRDPNAPRPRPGDMFGM
ncbi:hypothetical protein BU16DRAFT_581040 [Lophium mytilinum]|uniref:Uncharacterized protein n=1 Tax=Lophium mytilinum TaxID=390894 RepID=A0A6A6QXA1_9PEZI|nr:hypothetical protein BU16DRAFT_581040 [Lophium mytilinum]